MHGDSYLPCNENILPSKIPISVIWGDFSSSHKFSCPKGEISCLKVWSCRMVPWKIPAQILWGYAEGFQVRRECGWVVVWTPQGWTVKGCQLGRGAGAESRPGPAKQWSWWTTQLEPSGLCSSRRHRPEVRGSCRIRICLQLGLTDFDK